ncbi:MAG TPA: non-ribosomal peptide synthetase [Steroidobacteraceae bacterium]|jgi:acyl-CoA synthetase (AMP-forming)/AMP-acid ligase II/aryl carrier-like protein|nr:non-ribosomal peptide synthetase [Steroidobacteraceae bacterium]
MSPSPPTSPAISAPTLTALMESQRNYAGRLTYVAGERESHTIGYAELYERALAILHHLQRLGARPGDPLILLLASNEPFIDAFWAAILGGIVPVPIAPGISDEHRHKLLRIARRLKKPFLYTEQRLLERIGSFAAEQATPEERGAFQALAERAFLVDDLSELGRSGRPYRAAPGDVAFIQFSSGSTSEPKGVVLTHANLMANVRGSTEVAHFGSEDVSLSWMPLTHDMGLIGFHLVMFANRVHAHLMPTDLFVRRPLLWLQLASQVHASILCSPNFGYRHYLKVLGERSPEGLDLSAVRLLFNGAEPISVELCEEFLARLAPAGLSAHSMFPVYGLAEASLAVSFPAPGAPLRVQSLHRGHLGVGERVQELPAGPREALRLASVGRAIPYCEQRIADAADAAAPDGVVGHIQIRGQNVTAGYFEDAAANADTFTSDGWLRTGDLGVVLAGELYVTGRHKEILFVHGQNYYPHDLERMSEAVDGLTLGKVVIAGVRPLGAESDTVVAFVLHRGELADFLPLAQELSRRIAEHAGVEIDAVVPVRRIPKTTSGKVQRHLLEQEYLAGAFDAELAELAAQRRAQATVSPTALSADAIEQRLRAICEAELEGRTLEVDESLFDLGASSLKLIAIHERIEQSWPGAIDVTEIFEHPSIRALARLIESKTRSSAG